MKAERRLLISTALFLPLAAALVLVWPRVSTALGGIFRAQLAAACAIDTLVLLEASYSVIFHGRRPLLKAFAAVAAIAVISVAAFVIANGFINVS